MLDARYKDELAGSTQTTYTRKAGLTGQVEQIRVGQAITEVGNTQGYKIKWEVKQQNS